MLFSKKYAMPQPDEALPGRAEPISLENQHYVHSRAIKGPFSAQFEHIVFGLGCFWGAERKFWPLDGVYTTAVGYAQGFTPNPSYEEVCSGMTGHNEVVLVVYDPQVIRLEALLSLFWESHDPTQGMRQGNDRGTQYRSGIYTSTEAQLLLAKTSKEQYETVLKQAGFGPVTTEVLPLKQFYYAEQYHQQYLAKNPNGYCGLGGTGVCFKPT